MKDLREPPTHFLSSSYFIYYHVPQRFPTPHNNNQHLFKYQLVHNQCASVCVCGVCVRYIISLHLMCSQLQHFSGSATSCTISGRSPDERSPRATRYGPGLNTSTNGPLWLGLAWPARSNERAANCELFKRLPRTRARKESQEKTARNGQKGKQQRSFGGFRVRVRMREWD